MSTTPGVKTPAGIPGDYRTVEATGVAIDATGATTLGSIDTEDATVEEVEVTSDAQDFDFNVTQDGSDVFAAEQSPSGSPETFEPDQNDRPDDADATTFAADVSSASASGGATADFVVVVRYN